ncbi:MAG: trimethylamine methyltransferase family protein, partial [Actinomycetota bacterium]|nr:trimethylamine methyltransferase family protein [Actinomycetota bacterium]
MTEGRRGRLSGRTKVRDVAAEQPPWTQPRLPFEPLRGVSDDELEAIHKASLRVLAETGIDFLDETARRQLVDVGCQVDGDRVRFDPDLVMHLVSTAPAEFTMHAPSPARNLHMGGNVLTYTSV